MALIATIHNSARKSGQTSKLANVKFAEILYIEVLKSELEIYFNTRLGGDSRPIYFCMTYISRNFGSVHTVTTKNEYASE